MILFHILIAMRAIIMSDESDNESDNEKSLTFANNCVLHSSSPVNLDLVKVECRTRHSAECPSIGPLHYHVGEKKGLSLPFALAEGEFIAAVQRDIRGGCFRYLFKLPMEFFVGIEKLVEYGFSNGCDVVKGVIEFGPHIKDADDRKWTFESYIGKIVAINYFFDCSAIQNYKLIREKMEIADTIIRNWKNRYFYLIGKYNFKGRMPKSYQKLLNDRANWLNVINRLSQGQSDSNGCTFSFFYLGSAVTTQHPTFYDIHMITSIGVETLERISCHSNNYVTCSRIDGYAEFFRYFLLVKSGFVPDEMAAMILSYLPVFQLYGKTSSERKTYLDRALYFVTALTSGRLQLKEIWKEFRHITNAEWQNRLKIQIRKRW